MSPRCCFGSIMIIIRSSAPRGLQNSSSDTWFLQRPQAVRADPASRPSSARFGPGGSGLGRVSMATAGPGRGSGRMRSSPCSPSLSPRGIPGNSGTPAARACALRPVCRRPAWASRRSGGRAREPEAEALPRASEAAPRPGGTARAASCPARPRPALPARLPALRRARPRPARQPGRGSRRPRRRPRSRLPPPAPRRLTRPAPPARRPRCPTRSSCGPSKTETWMR